MQALVVDIQVFKALVVLERYRNIMLAMFLPIHFRLIL